MPRQLAKLAITALKSMQRGSWTLPVAGMLLATQAHDMGTVQSLHLHQKEKVPGQATLLRVVIRSESAWPDSTLALP